MNRLLVLVCLVGSTVAISGQTLGVVVMTSPAVGQVSLTPSRAPFLTSDQLTAVVETDAAAATIVSQALAYFVRVFPDTTTTLIASQIPPNWVPEIPGVQFIRLTDDAARTHLQECGRLLFVNSFGPPTSDAIAIHIAEGSRCTTSGLMLRFNRSANGWHRDADGIQGSSVGGTNHCPCRQLKPKTDPLPNSK